MMGDSSYKLKTMNSTRKFVWLLLASVLPSIPSLAQCTANAGGDLTICAGQSALLGGAPTASGGSGSYTYDWTNLSGADDIANPTVSPLITTTYTVTVDDGIGCIQTDNITVTVNALPAVNGGPDKEACLNGPNVILPNVGTWSGAAMVTAAGVFTPNAIGTFNLTVTSTVNGCSNSDQVTVVVHPLPTTSAGNDQTICSGQVVQFNASAVSPNGAISLFTWSGGSVSNSLIPNPTSSPTSTTTYNITAVDVEGCSDPDQITVFVLQPPAVNAGNDISLCTSSGPTQLGGFSPAGGTWSGSGVNAAGLFTPSVAGIYNLTYSYTNAQGCTGTDQVAVTVVAPGSINAGPDKEICHNAASLQLVPVDAGGTWSGSPMVNSSGLFTPTITGVHNLTYTLSIGACNATDQITVTVNSLPITDAGNNISICSGGSANLNGSASGGEAPYSITWNNGATLSSTNILNPIATPVLTTTYTLSIQDNNLCTSQDQVTVTVNLLPGVNAGNDITLCTTSGATVLSGYSPAGGSWSGTGVTAGGTYTPGIAGSVVLTYTYTNAQSCTASDQITVTVVAPGSIDGGPNQEICFGAAPMQLVPVNVGGSWSGSPQVSPTGMFTPSVAGTHNLVYSINQGACSASDQVVVTVNSLPVVSAGTDQVICSGNSATLNGSVSGGESPYNISWNNGTTLSSTSILNPIATPLISTTYTLTVTDNNTCVNTDAVLITVNSLPVVNAGNDFTVCDQPMVTVLTGYSPAGGTWSGTGVTANGNFTPSGAGNYTLTYSFIDGNGCSQSDQIIVNVTSVPSISAGPDKEVCLGTSSLVLSDYTSSSGTWSGLGITGVFDGSFDPNIAGAGTHIITISNGSGSCQVTDQVEIIVNALPVVNAGNDEVFCINENVTGLSGYTPAGGIWSGTGIDDDDDGTFDPSVGAGVYPVVYTYTEITTGCSSSDGKTITVSALPVPGFTIPTQGCNGVSVNPGNTSSGAINYNWNFDGNNLSGFEPGLTFSTDGIFQVVLTAYNGNGCHADITQDIEIISAPVASFITDTDEGCAPLSVNFTNNSTGQYITYSWDLATSVSSDFEPVTQTYFENLGLTNYDITLSVNNLCGSDTDTKSILVHPRPQADFMTDVVSTMCSPVTVEFINNSTGNPDNCTWLFGDGTNAMITDPDENTYYTTDTPTDYIIWLYVENSCGEDSVMQTITVLPNLVTAAFGTNGSSGCAPFGVEVDNQSVGATDVLFNFSDLSISDDENATFTYNDAGFYTIYQYATDGCGFDTTQTTIEVLESPTAELTIDLAEACVGTTITFTAEVTGAQNIIWNLGDGNFETDGVFTHVYNQEDVYDISLTAFGPNLCEATSTAELPVWDNPVALFTTDQTSLCSPSEMCIQNNTTNADNYIWNFGDNSGSVSEEPCHTYTNNTNDPLTYNITLVAENIHNCTSSFQSSVVVNPVPLSDFELSEYSSCFAPASATTVVQTPDEMSYEWAINGVPASGAVEPQLNFDQTGAFLVTLTVTNTEGCESTSQQTFTVYPEPSAAFSSDVQFGCTDFEVNYINLSTGAMQYEWNFGGQETSIEQSPSQSYTEEGSYTTSLIATSEFGCSDTVEVVDYIQAYGPPVADFTLFPEETSIYFPEITFTSFSEDADLVTWDFGDGGFIEGEEVIHSYGSPGEYTITLVATNFYGCQDSQSRNVLITNEMMVFIPNAFTPDDDGKNDVFIPEFSGKEFVFSYQFRIFDRWGVVIFETFDPFQAWTGNVNSGDYYAEPGVYLYDLVIKLDDSPGTSRFSGNVTVVR